MDTFAAILDRRSVRRYSDKAIEADKLDKILEAARWTPSGLNNQPWRFMLLDTDKKDSLAEFTHYAKIINGAQALIAVFLHTPSMYNRDKDMMSAGAAVQNMMLAAWEMGLGTCWLGEIVKRKDEVRRSLGLGEEFEFCAAVSIGYPLVDSSARRKRKDLDEIVLAT